MRHSSRQDDHIPRPQIHNQIILGFWISRAATEKESRAAFEHGVALVSDAVEMVGGIMLEHAAFEPVIGFYHLARGTGSGLEGKC